MRTGPVPAAADVTARRTTAYTAAASLPSTTVAGIPYPMPLWASEGAAVCLSSGTLIAYPLFWMRKTTGDFQTAAKFSAACVSPSLVAPSPSMTRATVSSPLIVAA